jgi:hypothetical protein
LKRLISFLLFLALFSLNKVHAHDYHIGIIDIHYNDSTKSLEVSVKMFVHDFEKALEIQGVENLRLGMPNEANKSDEYIQRYFLNHFEISLSDTVQFPNYIGKEIEDEHLWTYWEIQNISFKKIGVKCSMLFEVFEDQSFIVYLKKGIEKNSMLLNNTQPKEEVIFEK